MLDAEHQMRTTLTLDDDVLAAARVLARQRKHPIGQYGLGLGVEPRKAGSETLAVDPLQLVEHHLVGQRHL